MENSKAQLLERLQSANNILVTVSSNPSVDQLSAAIGLTLMLNKIGKQGTAVFSGKVPSTIEFLQPEKTIEKNTDSLRDFIIALDKSKADKLRYKVEDNHVKIFITPYRTSISEKDLQFSQGDFNVEVVIALGVKDQKDLDRAITAHGRILHDATTISVTNGEPGTVGSIDWDDAQASSLSEMVASLAPDLGADSLDGQIATALLTGIVAQTERFRNARTSPVTMTIGSTLMAAGANQQLIATKLEQAEPKPAKKDKEPTDEAPVEPEKAEPEATDDAGALRIEHKEPEAVAEPPAQDQTSEETKEEPTEEKTEEKTESVDKSSGITGGGSLILDPPTLGGKLTANAEPEHLDPPTDPLGVKPEAPLLQRQDKPQVDASPREDQFTPDVEEESSLPSDLPAPVSSEPPAVPSDLGIAPQEPAEEPVQDQEPAPLSLTEIEAAVQSSFDAPQESITPPAPETPAQQDTEPEVPDVSDARDAVSDALASIGGTQPLPPISALNAQPFDINDQLGSDVAQPLAFEDTPTTPLPSEPTDLSESVVDFSFPENLVPPAQPPVDTTGAPADPVAPPAVPPPFMPGMPGFDPSGMPPVEPPQDNQDNNQQPPAAPGNPFNLPPA